MVKMSEFPDTSANVSPEMAAMLENFQKKKALNATTNSRQNVMNSSTSSLKESSSQVVNSSTTTSSSTLTSTSQRLHHVRSTSEMSTSERKAHALKRDLSDIKNSMSEINTLAAMGRTQGVGDIKLSNTTTMNQLTEKIRSSIENLVDGPDNEPLVTFPDDTPSEELHLDLTTNRPGEMVLSNGHQLKTIGDTVKFEETRTVSASRNQIITDGYSSESASTNTAETKRLQAGDIDYKEAKAAAAVRNKIEMDGVTAEQNAAIIKEARSFTSGDIQQKESNQVSAAHTKIKSNTFTSEDRTISQAERRQTVTSSGIFNQEKFKRGHEKTITGTMSSSVRQINGSSRVDEMLSFDDLEQLCNNGNTKDVENAINKYSHYLDTNMKSLQRPEHEKKVPTVLDGINEVVRKAWAVPTYGHELGYSLCNTLRNSGGLDLLMKNCVARDRDLQFSSARLLEQCLTTENRSHVVDNGLEKVVNVACVCTKNLKTDHSRVGTGILEHLFKHSEGTCSDVIRLGGLDAVLFECRKNDVETLRHCAMALANLSLYGGAENQIHMINRKVPMWLFPLAFHDDDNIKYYACLAIAVLVANKEIEAEVLKSGTLDLVEPFVTSHNPSEFAKSNLAHAHGQSKHWLQRLVPVLSSNREEARNLAAFHFCMEAGIKKEQGNTEIFREIGAIEPLKTVASCPNAIASKFAAQALRLIGEEVPHKLSQQVPLWSVEDVSQWVKQIGFTEYIKNFYDSRVDGDLLLQLTEENLREDIGISNGIRRRRFRRELENLKKMADYSSKDVACLNNFLQNIGPEFSIYTYSMLNAGVDKESLKNLNDEQLIVECGITNSIHRFRILNSIKSLETTLALSSDENMDKTLDVFVSYRRSNGSQLASLLKVHLQLRGFSVFIDVERLEAGKFDNNLLQSIRQAKHFILVLTPRSLDRCIEDVEGKDWVHREIVAALTSNCNIIPIIDNFQWPEAEELPEDMRTVCHFNGVRWIHDYQDACVDKLERFMRGERDANLINCNYRGNATPSTPSTASTTVRQNPLIYQRMHSNDSDKDGANGSTSGTGRVSD
ncbi:NAD(+) hydrolase sarm1 isoform X4 [Bradysia coprophila]|uniref:NAD(+) hydrolase sarm1 isoform X4 n=1 Tax=Bradysia coprophila TaxID=38358 RepID=UPI00187DC4F1|nr:NAD(+) hydrolase sarm1 isoform X4 [Bradysia coprophila]